MSPKFAHLVLTSFLKSKLTYTMPLHVCAQKSSKPLKVSLAEVPESMGSLPQLLLTSLCISKWYLHLPIYSREFYFPATHILGNLLDSPSKQIPKSTHYISFSKPYPVQICALSLSRCTAKTAYTSPYSNLALLSG